MAHLQAAWASNRHSVVEVVTSRASNVDHHRAIQDAVRARLGHVSALLSGRTCADAFGWLALTRTLQRQPPHLSQYASLPLALLIPSAVLERTMTASKQVPGVSTQSNHHGCAGAGQARLQDLLSCTVGSLSLQELELPLQRPLTTGPAAHVRRVIRLHVQLHGANGSLLADGCGEVAPLPGELLSSQRCASATVDCCAAAAAVTQSCLCQSLVSCLSS